MKQFLRISPGRVVASLVAALVFANMLVGFSYLTNWWVCKVVLFVVIVLLPGIALLRAMRIVLGSFSVGILYSFGLSILVLMLSGLFANQVLHMFTPRPLGTIELLVVWDVVAALIIALSAATNSSYLSLKRWSVKKLSLHAYALAGLSMLLPCGAALGAFRLNNGGSALITELTLGYAAMLVVYAFLMRRRLPDGLLASFICIVGLMILLMTSLRSSTIVGHDIEREFRVYMLTHMHAHWDIALDRNPYNACLSITILPEMFARLLNMSGLIVFKFILQIIFAMCPVVIYFLLRQYVAKLGTLVGCLLFICYPTFINDSAMLTRQGVAYLFFALALLVVSNKAQKKRFKLLFSLCALGAVLSHYSTAYLLVSLFAAAVVCKLILLRLQKRRGKPSPHSKQRTVLSPLFAALLFLMTFVWYTQITATSKGLVTTLATSFSSIPKLFSGDNNDGKSSDTANVLLFSGGKSQIDLYESYLVNSQTRNDDASLAAVNAPEYLPMLTSDELPLTHIGKRVRAAGVDPSFVTLARQNFAKILQLLALIGVLYATYRLLRKKADAIDFDFICLNLAGLMLLALIVALPILSINYGILRAFQQILIFLILPITLLLAKLGRYLWVWLRVSVATLSIVLLFLLFTGVFAQVLGGSSPALSMNDRGLYYGLYYSSDADARAFTWIKQHITKNSDVRAANFGRASMTDPEYPFSKSGILPSQIGKKSYVYLGSAQVLSQKLYTYYDSSPLILSFPTGYYDAYRNQIYSTSSTRVYR